MKIEKVKCHIKYYHFSMEFELQFFDTENISKIINEADKGGISIDIESVTTSSADDYGFRCYYHPRSYLLEPTTSQNIKKRGQHFIQELTRLFEKIERC